MKILNRLSIEVQNRKSEIEKNKEELATDEHGLTLKKSVKIRG